MLKECANCGCDVYVWGISKPPNKRIVIHNKQLEHNLSCKCRTPEVKGNSPHNTGYPLARIMKTKRRIDLNEFYGSC